tara:strand:+ start:1543 stop:2454 length:912 start_codon:yes stop_codon:yes gene_type:complete
MAETVTRTLPAQFIEDLGRDYGTQLAALTALPVDTTKFAPTVAAQDALQTAAYQQATDPTKGLGAFQPFLTKAETAADAATGLTGTGAGAATQAGSIQSYMSPYQQDVIDTTLTEFDRQTQAQQAQQSARALGVPGAFGGGREGVLQAEFLANQARNRAGIQANLLQQGFKEAAARRQQDFANQQAIATQQATLGGGLQNLVQQQISGLGRLGGIQQSQQQAIEDAARQTAQTQAYEPYQRLGTYGTGVAQLISGYPGQTQIAQTPQASPLQTALGLGAGIAGIYGGLTGKNPFAPIAKTLGF